MLQLVAYGYVTGNSRSSLVSRHPTAAVYTDWMYKDFKSVLLFVGSPYAAHDNRAWQEPITEHVQTEIPCSCDFGAVYKRLNFIIYLFTGYSKMATSQFYPHWPIDLDKTVLPRRLDVEYIG